MTYSALSIERIHFGAPSIPPTRERSRGALHRTRRCLASSFCAD